MTVLTSTWGWRYLFVGVMSCLMLAAVAAINTQDPFVAVVLAAAALAFYVGIFELYSLAKATARPLVVVAAGVGMIVCFVVLMGVTEAVITGRFSLLPNRPSWWALPIGAALWTAYELWRRRRSAQPLT